MPSSLHNSKHTEHNTHSITPYKGVQPNGSLCANNHCSTRYEQSFRHNKHTHTNSKAATDQHSRHNNEIHRKLHQMTQNLHNIQKPHIHTTLKWRSSRWRPLTHTIQHLHCRLTTNQRTGSGHGIHRLHLHTQAKKHIQPYLDKVFVWT